MNQAIAIEEVFDKTAFEPASFFPSAPFTQAFFYGEWQKAAGRKVRRFVMSEDGQPIGFFQVIIFSLPFNRKCAYIPYGPVLVRPVDDVLLKELRNFLHNMSCEEGVMFTRLDFSPPLLDDGSKKLLRAHFTKAKRATYHAAFLQPRYEWQINVTKTEGELFDAFHKNTRYSVKVSEKSGVTTEVVERELSRHFDTFYSVLSETAQRDHFHLHAKEYYQNIFRQCEISNNAVLVLGSYQGKVLAANLVVFYGDTAMFAFGGTRSEHRNVMPAYATQWTTIKYLKSKGVQWYNFGGIDGEDGVSHKNWKGFSSFKKRFGGQVLEHSELYDVVIQPFWYRLYNLYKFFRKS